jgi:hypothetical protein
MITHLFQTNAFEFAKSFPAALWLLPNIAELIAPARAKPFKT